MTAHHDPQHDAQQDQHEHDLGLQHDMRTLRRRGPGGHGMGRRGVLGVLGGLSVVAVAGCAADESTTSSVTGTASASTTTRPAPPSPPGGDSSVDVAVGEIPEETAGPFPGDGSNGPNVLAESGVLRRDITASFGTASGVAGGVPLTIRLKVYDLADGEATVLAGAAIYAWHCDRDGAYSMYDGDAVDENYLRGIQESDADGWVEFTSIFPGCYSGRWPHVHFEVYESLDAATSASNKLRTSQLAFPETQCEEVYASAGYESSVDNLAQVSLDSDGIFSDGYSLQLASMKGSVAEGYTATLSVPV